LRVEFHCACEHPPRDLQVVFRQSVHELAAAQVVSVGLNILGRYLLDRFLLLRQQLYFQLIDNGVGDLVLNGKDVDQIAIEPFSPKMTAVAAADELTSYSHAFSRLAHTTFHDESDSELTPDLLHL